MRVIFLDLASSYSHASVALPIFERITSRDLNFVEWFVVRGTIQDNPWDLLVKLHNFHPQIVLATCYLFNHRELTFLLQRFKLFNPSCWIFLGGPEFLGNNQRWLEMNPWCNAVIRGEGEITLSKLLSCIQKDQDWSCIPGICYRDQSGQYHDYGIAKTPVSFLEQYEPGCFSPFFVLDKPFVYIESQRGCPCTCRFCTSELGSRVEYFSIDYLYRQLQYLRKRNVRRLRFLDRTFNSSQRHALAILQLFWEEFTEFEVHLEIHPGFLSTTLLNYLKKFPEGRLHLETGIQSFSQQVRYIIGRRPQKVHRERNNLFRLTTETHCEVHADLIGGLPGQTMEDLLQDIRFLVQSQVSEIQLEILKILPGTSLAHQASSIGIVYASSPPYEVLTTNTINFEELNWIRLWSKVLDRYYNAKELRPLFYKAMLQISDFLNQFTLFLSEHNQLAYPQNPENRFLYLFQFLIRRDACNLAEELAYEWLKAGLSPEKCPIPAKRIPPPRNFPNGEWILPSPQEEVASCQWWSWPVENPKYWLGYNRHLERRRPIMIYRIHHSIS